MRAPPPLDVQALALRTSLLVVVASEQKPLVPVPRRVERGEHVGRGEAVHADAIARAIAKRPQVLLCDEPTGALDSTTGVVVLEALNRINREIGTTTVIITHNAVVAGMADRVLHLTDGTISQAEINKMKISPEEMHW